MNEKLEKLSESHVRDVKVQKLKTKILDEISKRSLCVKNQIKTFIDSGVYDYYDSAIKEEFILQRLKAWCETDDAFCMRRYWEEESDIIIYWIPDDDLNVWLQDDYSFITRFLKYIERYDLAGCIDATLSDPAIAQNLVCSIEGAIDFISYQRKTAETKI